MGIGKLNVIPDIAGVAIAFLPSTYKVIGSFDDNDYISLKLQSDLLPNGVITNLIGEVTIDGNKKIFTLKEI